MLVIDRFEGNYAVVEHNNKTYKLPKEILPNNVKEGDIIKIIVDKETTKGRKENIQDLADDLFE